MAKNIQSSDRNIRKVSTHSIHSVSMSMYQEMLHAQGIEQSLPQVLPVGDKSIETAEMTTQQMDKLLGE